MIALLCAGCGGSVDSTPVDAAADTVADGDASPPEIGPPIDVGPSSCAAPNPLSPPVGCGPTDEGAPPCGSTTSVATCPTDTACMATAKQTGAVLAHRVSRLRLYAPESLVSLTSIAFDPQMNARCVNSGAESFNWLLRIDLATLILRTGPAKPSPDGVSFTFANEKISDPGVVCPGFTAPPTTLRAVDSIIERVGDGFATPLLDGLSLAVYDAAGLPMVVPLREAQLRVRSIADPSCIGRWDRSYWCDGDTLGWTTGGSLVAKILADDADNVPVKPGGCQSLCAILVNDASKTDGKRCKRGPDGKVIPMGDTCIGGMECKNAFNFTATFASYGVKITP